jgi:hypothetical protein
MWILDTLEDKTIALIRGAVPHEVKISLRSENQNESSYAIVLTRFGERHANLQCD